MHLKVRMSVNNKKRLHSGLEKHIRKHNNQESDDSESESDSDTEDDDFSDDSEVSDDNEEDLTDEQEEAMRNIPKKLFVYAFNLLHEGDASQMKQVQNAVEKILIFTLESDSELKKLSDKIAKRKGKNDGKVPPGSANVKRNLDDDRFLIGQCKVLLGRLYMFYMNDPKLTYYIDNAIDNLREAVLWYPKSAEAHYLLGQLLKFKSNSYESLEEVEMHYKKSASIVIDGGDIEGASSNNKDSILGSLGSTIIDDKNTENALATMDSINMFLIIREKEKIRLATEQLCLIYLQFYNTESGYYNKTKLQDASQYLIKCGFKHRLSDEVLCYPSAETTVKSNTNDAGLYAHCRDNMLPEFMLDHLKYVFRPEAPYWSEHNYDAYVGNYSKKCGYFSYLYHFRDAKASNSMEQILDYVYSIVSEQFPKVAEKATVAEWWVHSRPYCNGHQFHYDSDETNTSDGEAPRHPLATCVLYCCEAGNDFIIGGPTLLTNQALPSSIKDIHEETKSVTGPVQDPQVLATKGYICLPKHNRMTTFDSRYLHGVIPGRQFPINGSAASSAANNSSSKRVKVENRDGITSSSNSCTEASSDNNRRLTVMIGFWDGICARDRGANNPGPGQPFPSPATSNYTWPAEMKPFDPKLLSELNTEPASDGVVVEPIPISRIWQPIAATANGVENSALLPVVPTYNECFQGF